MAIEIIPDKICPHCGGNTWTPRKSTVNGKIYIIYDCIIKLKENRKRYYEKNKEAIRRKQKTNYSFELPQKYSNLVAT